MWSSLLLCFLCVGKCVNVLSRQTKITISEPRPRERQHLRRINHVKYTYIYVEQNHHNRKTSSAEEAHI